MSNCNSVEVEHKCSKCKVVKPADCFFRDRRKASGRRSICKVCDESRQQETKRAKDTARHTPTCVSDFLVGRTHLRAKS